MEDSPNLKTRKGSDQNTTILTMNDRDELLRTYRELNQTYKTRDTEHLNRVLSQKWLIILGFGFLSVLVLSVVFSQYKLSWQLSTIKNQNLELEKELKDSRIEELSQQIKSLEAAVRGDNKQALQLEIEQLRRELKTTKSLQVEDCKYFLGVFKTQCQQINHD